MIAGAVAGPRAVPIRGFHPAGYRARALALGLVWVLAAAPGLVALFAVLVLTAPSLARGQVQASSGTPVEQVVVRIVDRPAPEGRSPAARPEGLRARLRQRRPSPAAWATGVPVAGTPARHGRDAAHRSGCLFGGCALRRGGVALRPGGTALRPGGAALRPGAGAPRRGPRVIPGHGRGSLLLA